MKSSATDSPEYENPPRKWPFPPLGRNTFLGIALLLLALTLLPFWGAIAVAGVFAFGLDPVVDRISRRVGNRRRLVSLVVVTGLSVLLLFPAGLLSFRLYETIADKKGGNNSGMLSSQTLERVTSAKTKLENGLVHLGVESKLFQDGEQVKESLRQNASSLFKQVMTVFSAAVVSLPEIAVTLIVFGIFLYSFLAYPKELGQYAFRLHLFRPRDLKRSIAILQASSYNSLVSNFAVGLIQASIITIGAKAVGYDESLLIFSTVFLFSYIPFIGSAPVGYGLSILSFLTAGTGEGIAMAVVATFAGVIDNLLRPYLVASGGKEVSPVLSFASIIGAIGVFGLKGIFLGPVIVTAAIAFLGRPKSGNVDAKPEHKGGILARLKGRSTDNENHARSA